MRDNFCLVLFLTKTKTKLKEKKIINFLEKRHFTLIQKANIFSISLFSNLKGGDYLLVNNKYDFKR